MARPLRFQVLAITAATVVVLSAALFYASRQTYEEQLRQFEDETKTMATTVVAYLNRSLMVADAIGEATARHPGVQQADARVSAQVLAPLIGGAEGLIRNAVLADADGRPVVWARVPDANVEGVVASVWLRSIASDGQPRISRLLGGPGDAAHAIVMAYPIRGASGAAIGVIGLALHLEALEQVLVSLPLPPSSVVTVTDEDSVVVARSLDSTAFVGRPIQLDGRPLAPSSVPRSAILTGIDGVERVFGNAVVDRGPWLVSVGIPTAVAWQRTAPIYRRSYTIALVWTAIVFALAWTFVGRWLRAFASLDHTADRVAKGDLSELQPRAMPTAELEQLQGRLADMIKELRTTREAISGQVQDERRMRQEVQSLQQQVIRQERLAAIGVLVSGVAHELNNPLQAILGFAELLQLHQDMPEQARAELTLIQKESTRASAIIRNLSRFGRQKSEPAPVMLGDVVQSVLELRQRNLDERGIALVVDVPATSPVGAVFTELQQVVLNFVINAEQAVVHNDVRPRRVAIRVREHNGRVRLEVEDTGAGVPPEDEQKLFQPFFTTKPVGEGTGLGLSVSYGIIQSYGGQIGYQRAPDGGALFYLELPAA